MPLKVENRRSNLAIFEYEGSGSPMHDLMVHISKPLSDNQRARGGGLGINLLDYERCKRKGPTLYTATGDSLPDSREKEDARIGTLEHAIKKLGNTPDAVEFILCVDALCGEGCHPLGRQWICSYWYNEIDSGDRREVLKQMGIAAMYLASAEPVIEVTEGEIEDEIMDVGLRDKDAHLTTFAHARKVLGNVEDATTFILCLEEICGNDCTPRDRLRNAAFYYNEIKYLGAEVALKRMSLLAMQYASLKPKPVAKTAEADQGVAVNGHQQPDPAAKTAEADQSIAVNGHPASNHAPASQNGYYPSLGERLIKEEIKPIIRMIRGHRRAVILDDDEPTEWLLEPELEDDATDDSDEDSAPEEPTAQLDEGGLGITMSSFDRILNCGRLEPEFTDDDLPGEDVRDLADYLRLAFASGVEIKKIWEEINAELKTVFPISIGTRLPKAYFPSNRTTGRTNLMAIERRPRSVSPANIELQQHTREVLKAILDDCYRDVQMMALRSNRTYRRLHTAIRRATDTKEVGQIMKEAYKLKEDGKLHLKLFTLLVSASVIKRARLMAARLSKEGNKLMHRIRTASVRDLKTMAWEFFGDNKPGHPIHSLPSQEEARMWDALKERRQFFAMKFATAVLTNRFVTKSKALENLLILLIFAALHHHISRLPKKFEPNSKAGNKA